ncbi:hypothetical protein EOM60_03060 [Candidatus Saccharibacteria bacterium]|nr:hypothetical protein [Candidatus Saccharibacteria bacterium]
MSNIIKNDLKKTKKNRRKVSKKQKIIMLVIGVALLAGGVALYLTLGGSIEPKNTDYIREEGAQMTNKTKQGVDDLNQLRLSARDDPSSKHDEIMEGYDELLNSAPDDQDRQVILLRQASYLTNLEKYEEALIVAQKAETIISDFASDSLIARIAEDKGDNQMAIKYYKKILNQFDKDSPRYQISYNQTQSKIDELESKL